MSLENQIKYTVIWSMDPLFIENIFSFDNKHNPGEITSLSKSNHSH